MTREEAIDIVKCLAWHDLRPSEEDIEQAIEALSEPTKTGTDEMWQEFESQLLREIHTPMTMDYDSSIRMAEMGIKEVLNKWKYRLSEPKTEPTCEDVISREQAIRATYGFERYTGIDEAPYEYTETILRKLPTATPTRPKAKWIERDLESYNPITRDRKIYVCSNCHLGIDSSVHRFANYCPNCGAKMEESEEV